MTIIDDGSILPLTAVYITTTSAVLICEAIDEVKPDIKHWKIFLAPKGETPAEVIHSVTTDVINPISYLYYRAQELKRDTTYQAYVIGVDTADNESSPSNTITFTTRPKF